jgi:Holliday junction resolvase RusA-like endonuclease
MGWTRDRRRRVWYTPEGTRRYARDVAWHGQIARRAWEEQAQQRWPMTGTYALDLRVLTARRTADADNYLKLVADALQGVCWRNDRAVTTARVELLSVPAEHEALEVTVHALGREPL